MSELSVLSHQLAAAERRAGIYALGLRQIIEEGKRADTIPFSTDIQAYKIAGRALDEGADHGADAR